MKRNICCIIRTVLFLNAIFFVNGIYAQTTIKMVKNPSGTFSLRCKVNGALMKMIFDTGASSVSISRSTALYLYNNDLISENDYIGEISSRIANGDIIDNMLIRLRDVEIEGLHLKDVEAMVSSSLNAPLLLGQNVISKLGKITLDGDVLIIHSVQSQSLTTERRIELENQIRNLRINRIKDADSDYKILELIDVIEKSSELNEYELFCKLTSESNVNKLDEALVDAENWIKKYATETDSLEMKMRTFFISARTNILSEKGNKELGMQHLNRCRNYFFNDTTAHFFWFHLPNLTSEYCKYKNNGVLDAIYSSKAAIQHYLKTEGITIKDINENRCPQSVAQLPLGALAYNNSLQFSWLNKSGRWSDTQTKIVNLCVILAAKAGNPSSIDFCQQNNLDYNRKLTQKELDLVGLKNF